LKFTKKFGSALKLFSFFLSGNESRPNETRLQGCNEAKPEQSEEETGQKERQNG
jgi:hypothetical protein